MNTSVANTIINQLGGNKFIVMTGAKNFIALENGVKFNIGRNNSKANTVTITLNSLDLYDVIFSKFTPFKFNVKTMTAREEKNEIVKTYDSCYSDMLQDVFTSVTGLYTHL